MVIRQRRIPAPLFLHLLECVLILSASRPLAAAEKADKSAPTMGAQVEEVEPDHALTLDKFGRQLIVFLWCLRIKYLVEPEPEY